MKIYVPIRNVSFKHNRNLKKTLFLDTIRVRANDNLGPGKLSNAMSVKTKEAAKRPNVEIAEGEELRVSPNESFVLNCNVTRGDPTPVIVWESKGRKISNPQEGLSTALQHKGLLEETSFLCVAENEAGKTSKRIHVIVTGPTAPENVRSKVDGNDLTISWSEVCFRRSFQYNLFKLSP